MFFFLQDTKDSVSSMTLLGGSSPFVFLSERQSLAAATLPALISLSKCLTSRFTSHFFYF